MEKLALNYSGMDLGLLATWLLVATAAGFAARKIVRGKSIFALWGDCAIALIGVFLVGTLLKALNFSMADWIDGLNLGAFTQFARWIDVALVALLGALIIRAVLRPVTGKG